MERKILVCEDSLEGVFTGVYEAYANKYGHENTFLQIKEEVNLELFSEYIPVIPDPLKARKVSRTIIREFGEETYLMFCRALTTEDPEKGNAVYHVIVYGLCSSNKRQIMGHFANLHVNKVFELSRYANNEILHLNGFLRFQELENQILFAKIGPRNNILTFLAPHFADRLPLENFVIYDDTREIFVVHPAKKQWYIVTGETLDQEMITNYSEKELKYRELFTFFCQKIAIKERKNLALQRNMLPIRFQEYMVEFQ